MKARRDLFAYAKKSRESGISWLEPWLRVAALRRFSRGALSLITGFLWPYKSAEHVLHADERWRKAVSCSPTALSV
ncbi:hypothetical protein, partial [Xanthomonas arboricola]|uniref:hypothetical protein n=1 Tax=Xanthomonas arboricola TaxID=56448 RepID=UPI001CA563DC